MKRGSSDLVNRHPRIKVGLRWAPEYSATSVSPKHIDRVKRYIETQSEHHPGEGITG
jgi:REP element-mobilizing transposase RayT